MAGMKGIVRENCIAGMKQTVRENYSWDEGESERTLAGMKGTCSEENNSWEEGDS
jgi:hypothetical protein